MIQATCYFSLSRNLANDPFFILNTAPPLKLWRQLLKFPWNFDFEVCHKSDFIFKYFLDLFRNPFRQMKDGNFRFILVMDQKVDWGLVPYI